jgi:DNA-binding transcriptional regulator GbsR (MarR family)
VNGRRSPPAGAALKINPPLGAPPTPLKKNWFSNKKTKYLLYLYTRTSKTILEKYRVQIERHSATMEAMGLTPVAARVFVYLLLSEQHQATFEQMVDYFGVSKSAVSNALKMLEAVKMVEARTLGGQRKRYFSVNIKNMFSENYLSSKIKEFYTILDEVINTRQVNDDFNAELEDVSELYKMMLFEIPLILERWKRTVELKRKNK